MNRYALYGIIIGCVFMLYIIFVVIIEPQEHCDIIIVGTGLAGLSSAYEAYRLSKGYLRIVMIEKDSSYGGNSKRATSGINLLNTPIQKINNINDSYDLFYNDTMKSSKNLSNPDLVSTLVNDSTDLFQFYKDIGLDLNKVSILGGHTVPRTHRPEKLPVGYALTSRLFTLLFHESTIEIKYNCSVTGLIYNERDNKVRGIDYIDLKTNKTKSLMSKVVILATGGYAHDYDPKTSLLKEFVPLLMKYPTTNGDGSSGIGVKISRKIGAKLIDMDKVQVHPTGFVDIKNEFEKKKLLAPELLRGVGGILVNQTGNRFCNELGTRNYVTQQILANCEKKTNGIVEQYEAFILINQEGVDNYGNNINFYIKKGLLSSYENFTAFGNAFNISENNLKKTIQQYNMNYENNIDEFNKTIFPLKFNYNSTIYAGIVSPSIHYTMGGVKINRDGEVINTEGNVIKGLYGAGEVTGGVHGGNRLGGNSLLECAVFGKRVSDAALEYINKYYY